MTYLLESTMPKIYDLIIVGGGLVGAGLAVALHGTGLTIALIDARKPSSDDPRLFALNKSSCQFLENLGLWDALAKYAAAIKDVHVSHKGHFGAVRLRGHDVAAVALGHVIPAYKIETALNDRLLALPDVTLYRPATLTTLTEANGMVTLTIASDEKNIRLQSAIVMGADGTASIVRDQAAIAAETFDYQQSAVVTRTRLHRSHLHIAYERFNKTGAIAMLPLVNNDYHECATIWTADNAKASELMAMSDAAFLEALQNEFGYRLGRLQAISTRHFFPLRMLCAEKAVNQGVLLLGNALHTLHPIAAQGFNLALYEVALLAEGIKERCAKKELFSITDLQNMIARSEKQQTVSMSVSHRLPQLFRGTSMLTSLLTQAGMTAFDMAQPLKKIFINRMMGRTGTVPRLLLGANE